MADPTNAEIHALITDLKNSLVTPLKTYVMHNPASNLVTEKFLTAKLEQLTKDIKAGPDPQPKSWWEGLMEFLGLKDLAAIVKDAGKLGIFYAVLAGLGALVAAFGLKLLDFGAMFKSFMEFATRNSAGGRRILAPGPSGLPSLQNRLAVENPVVGALHALPNPATLEPLREKLSILNPKIEKFNVEIDKMPSARQLKQMASALEKIATALARMVPATIKAVATEVGKLKDNMQGLDLSELPKPRTLTQTATAMGRLAGATDGLATKLRELGTAANTAAGAVGTS
ncbi:hypothetical protein OG898_08350 [Streptomyces sp. NBC_00193]|uniref:hypothetical protein n=1 Tax=unclassified Streptomyces TaxID=2593676 RepID=UPI00225B296D|nr:MULTISPECIES: hypothetical protein [unclassified Streptomyces]MCX5123158.1 hypothetical protein [Streptomyces sp. NBC_00347]MCX5296504.1 hypothetical protein [Streptomyces sp. NBC_00193]